MKKYIVSGVIVLLVLLCGMSGCITYNNFVTQNQDIDQQWAQVEVQYQRRMDLIPNLTRTVQGYAAHESETFESVTRARAGLDNALAAAQADSLGTSAADAAAFNRVNSAQDQLNRALSIYVNAVREAYPDLKADTQFLNLQEQLEGTENRIATERGRYTEKVREYNVLVSKFPAKIWASLFGFQPKSQFAADAQAAQAPVVQF